jgi:hypothetical protein
MINCFQTLLSISTRAVTPWNRRVEAGHIAYQAKSYMAALVPYMKAGLIECTMSKQSGDGNAPSGQGGGCGECVRVHWHTMNPKP